MQCLPSPAGSSPLLVAQNAEEASVTCREGKRAFFVLSWYVGLEKGWLQGSVTLADKRPPRGEIRR